MKTKSTLLTMCAVVLIALAMTACEERDTQSASPPGITEQSKPENVSEENSAQTQAVGINADAVWALGKEFPEINERLGEVTGTFSGGKLYQFEHGCGRYSWDSDGGVCKAVYNIKAADFISGDLGEITLDNIAEKCGFEVVPLNDTGDPNTMYEGYRQAYYTHPSYENVTFSMLYKESGFDDTASFDARLNSET
ncbi:MAG: hypothetical protein K2J77_02765 [Oscillospiraceae bacterium]|nr:hypothetical protein [Oscillospiraceae bacterium]